MRLTPTMREAVAIIKQDPKGRIYPEGGGYWATSLGRVGFSTHTIYALEKRGILRRLNMTSEPWRDGYELAEAAPAPQEGEGK